MNDRIAENDQRRWAIVGGGMLGMTLALRLAQRGARVCLIEAADHLGGLADAWRLGDVTWDRHYHVTLLSDLRLRHLLAELGLDEQLRWEETKTGFYVDGQLVSMSSLPEFLRFPPLSLLDKLRLGGTIFYASKIRRWQRLEKVSAVDWLRRHCGQRTLEKIWLPLLRAKLGENYRHVSATFIWATIARMYAARHSGLKKERFGYLPGGYAAALACLEAKLRTLGVQIRTGTPVAQVRATAEGVRLETAEGESETFAAAVLTVPGQQVERLCPGLSPEEAQRHRDIRYQGIVCASLLTAKPLSPYYVTNITDSWVPFTAVIEMGALVDRAEFGGASLVYLPKYVDPSDPLFEESDASIRQRFLAALERMHPHFSREDVQAFRVSRARQVMAIPTLNYSAQLPPIRTSLPGVYVVNSAQIVNNTLNVNQTVQLAEDALAGPLSEMLSRAAHPCTADIAAASRGGALHV